MKRAILICDCCKHPVPAVKSVDVCQTHLTLLMQLGHKKPKQHAKVKPIWNKINYDGVAPKILELAANRPFFTSSEVARLLKVSKYTADVTCRKLIHERKIEATGKGAGRKLSKAS